MKPIHVILILISMGLGQGLSAQSLSRSVIGSTGSSNEKLSYTVGETVTQTGTANTIVLTQGFQQPDTTIATFLDPEVGEVDLKVYPNPTAEVLYVELAGGQYQMGMFDIRGRQLSPTIVEQNEQRTAFDVSQLARGTYLLMIRNGNGKILEQIKFEKMD